MAITVVQGLTEGALTEVNVNPTNRQFIKFSTWLKDIKRMDTGMPHHNGKMIHMGISPDTFTGDDSLLNHWVWLWSSRDRIQFSRWKCLNHVFFSRRFNITMLRYPFFVGFIQVCGQWLGQNPGDLDISQPTSWQLWSWTFTTPPNKC